MGQYFGFEKIAQLTQSGNTIYLPPSVLKIGGQGYQTTTTLSKTFSSFTSLTLYYIYAVIVNGEVTLVNSSYPNSIGPNPATYDRWRLVGAFYSNGASTPAFGSFISITGVPQCDFIDCTFTTSWDAYCSRVAKIKRVGDMAFINAAMNLTGTPSGNLSTINYPLTCDSNKFVYASTAYGKNTRATVRDNGAGTYWANFLMYSSQGQLLIDNGNFVSPTSPCSFNAGDSIAWEYWIPVSGWSNTALIDL